MLHYKRSLIQLPKAITGLRLNNALAGARFNSSSSVNNKVELDTATSTSTTATSDSKTTAPSVKRQEEKKLAFMPVINIPETEFAHHTFFSLDRPLLGLSDEEEKPFFSNKAEISEEEKLDDMLANYMMHLLPFVPPESTAPSTSNQEKQDQDTTYFNITTEEQDMNQMINDMDDINRQPELSVFHMPESGDVLDYLTTIESNMKTEHAKLDKEESEKALRLKKLEILDNVKRFSSRPRFSNSRNTIQQRLRRYVLKK